MLRNRKFSFPAADKELLHSFYPLVMNFMLEVQIQDLNEPDGMLQSIPHVLLHAFSQNLILVLTCTLPVHPSCVGIMLPGMAVGVFVLMLLTGLNIQHINFDLCM